MRWIRRTAIVLLGVIVLVVSAVVRMMWAERRVTSFCDSVVIGGSALRDGRSSKLGRRTRSGGRPTVANHLMVTIHWIKR
jgi:hypothetical protein